MTQPNLFIVGAPKCGTTSLAAWLAEHPQVYFSSVKEPHFLNSDQDYHFVSSQKEYDALFAAADAPVVAEASVYYAYSASALRRIASDYKDSKIILCIRDPVEMIRSLFQQQLFASYEDICDFATMWRMHDERLASGQLPAKCPDPIHINYKRTCSLGDALETIWTFLPKDRTHVVSLDAMGAHPAETFSKVCTFLRIDATFAPDFRHHNKAKEKSHPFIFDGLREIGKLKRALGIKGGTGVHRWLNARLLRPASPIALEQELQREIAAYFRPQTEKLERLLGLDLARWKRTR